MDITQEINEIVSKAIPLPRSCQMKIQRAEWEREQLKIRILQLLDKYRNFTKICENEVVQLGTEKDRENAVTC